MARRTRLLFPGPARTHVDILDSPFHCGVFSATAAEILNAYLNEYDPGMLIEFVTDWVIEPCLSDSAISLKFTNQEFPDVIAACQERVATGISALDPAAERRHGS